MAIEKSISVAPQGIDDIEGEEIEQELEIEIVNPDMVTLDDGSVEITLIPDAKSLNLLDFDANLAEGMEENVLTELADDLIGLIDSDMDSRKEWADTYVKGLEIIGFKYEARTTPWEGACGVNSTVLAEAAIRFQAETMSETFPAAGPVRVKVLGDETKEKEQAAQRVKADMNYQLTENMVEYRPEHERMLYSLGLAGSAFKKVYFDPNIGRQTAIYIPAEDVIVPYGASNIEFAERVTHIMRKTKNELRKLQASGFYRDIELGEPQAFHTDIEEKKAEDGGFSITDDDRYAMYEVHADLVIEGVDEDDDEIAKPYIVTIERGSNEVLSIRRNWNPDDELELKRQHFVHYVYVPGFGFYGDDTPIEPGEFKDVDVPSGSIRENIMPLPYKEPSQTLLALLDKITNEGRRLGAISDMNISDMSANAPVGTTLALLERTLKPMAAVQARVHYAMKQEFKMLKAIISEYASTQYDYNPVRGQVGAKRSDYMMVEVIPVSDPNSSTMAQRVVQYQAVLQMAQQAPQIYDLPQLHRQMIEVLGIKNADKLVPVKEDVNPTDPVSENMNALTGTPIRAFIHQDHDAHMAAHQAFIQDPMIAQTIGQNPQAQQINAALQAHIAEHLGFKYRKQVEEKLGVPLPPPNEELPKDVEVLLAGVIADAGKQLTEQHKQEVAQKQAQAQQQDPVLQMQQAELQVKQQEVQRKAQKDQGDMQMKQAELQLKAQKIQADTRIDEAQLNLDRQELELDAQKAGAKLAADRRVANTKLDLDLMKEVTNKRKE